MTKKINEDITELVGSFKKDTLESRIERTENEKEIVQNYGLAQNYGLIKGLVTVAAGYTIDKVMEKKGKETYFKYGALGYAMTTLGLKGLKGLALKGLKGLALKELDKQKNKLEKELKN